MTISCWRWLKTAINGGNLWSTAPQPKDDDDDDDDDDACACLRIEHVYFDILSPVFLELGRLMLSVCRTMIRLLCC